MEKIKYKNKKRMNFINNLLSINLINKFIQIVIPEEYFKDWAYTFYPMLDWGENESIEEMVKRISPYWDSVCLSYRDSPLDELFEMKYGKLDREIQIFHRSRHT